MNNSREMMSVLRADLQGFILIEVEPRLYNLHGIFGGEVFDLSPTCYVAGVEFPLYLSLDRTAAPVGTIKFKGDEVHFAGQEMTKCRAMVVRNSDVLQVRVIVEEDYLSFDRVIAIARENHQYDDFVATHFAEWLFNQKEVRDALDNSRIKLVTETEVSQWTERYEHRTIRVLNVLPVEAFAEQFHELRVEGLSSETFTELAGKHHLDIDTVELDFRFTKGESYVIATRTGWKLFHVR